MKVFDPWHYLVGNYRYGIYYGHTWWSFLPMRKHIRSQIDFRIIVMNPKCYEQGTCVACGCNTTALQMASKTCDEECYPKMMTKKKWKTYPIALMIRKSKDKWAGKQK